MLMKKIGWYWPRFWMRLTGIPFLARIATRIAMVGTSSPLKRCFLADLTPKGFISPSSTFDGSKIKLGSNVFIDDRVLISEEPGAGSVEIGDRVKIF
jgi:hypothetical protein